MSSKLFPGVQTFFQEIGESACYALTIIKIAERITALVIDPIEALRRGINFKDIYYNQEDHNDSNNFYVNDPAAFLSRITSVDVTVRKEANVNYGPAPNEFIVQCWERQMTGKTITHFRLPDWDSLNDSQTVKYGKVASLRVFKVA